MTQAARALEIACDSRKQKLYHLNRPKGDVVADRRRDVLWTLWKHRNKSGQSGGDVDVLYG